MRYSLHIHTTLVWAFELIINMFTENENKYFSLIRYIEGNIWLVPCIAVFSTNTFNPIFNPLKSITMIPERTNFKRWSDIEDEALKEIVAKTGPHSWVQIGKELNALLYENKEIRDGRQCKERWINHLDPDLIKGKWTSQEDLIILEKQKEIGNKWSDISRDLKGRTENSVKNRWNALIKKAKKDRFSSEDVVERLIQEKVKETRGGNRQIGVFQPLRMSKDDMQVDSVRKKLAEIAVPETENENNRESTENTPSPSIFLNKNSPH